MKRIRFSKAGYMHVFAKQERFHLFFIKEDWYNPVSEMNRCMI
jgi:hypothetical protein